MLVLPAIDYLIAISTIDDRDVPSDDFNQQRNEVDIPWIRVAISDADGAPQWDYHVQANRHGVACVWQNIKKDFGLPDVSESVEADIQQYLMASKVAEPPPPLRISREKTGGGLQFPSAA